MIYHAMLQAGFLLVIFKPPSTSALFIKAHLHDVAF